MRYWCSYITIWHTRTVLPLVLLVVACSSHNLSQPANNKPVQSIKTAPAVPPHDTVIHYSFRDRFDVSVEIKYPSRSNGYSVLMLHGFNLPPLQWCDKTGFCQQALDSGYTLIIPQFGKTTYQFVFYQQTIAKYLLYPTRQWMLDTLFPHLQKNFGLLLPDTSTFVAGISTGGRGAVLLAADLPAVFKAFASLSGDFDQTLMPGEAIYTGYYGSFKEFKNRWYNIDNPMRYVTTWTVPCFLAHGLQDNVSPASQTQLFSDSLRVHRPDVVQQTFFPLDRGHDYTFWNECTQPMLRFFYHCRHLSYRP